MKLKANGIRGEGAARQGGPLDRALAFFDVLPRELSDCGSFYAMGGGFSFYFWAEKPTPTGLNNNNPLDLLTWPEQQRLIADLDAAPNLCVLRSPGLLQLFDRGQIATRPPLLRYVDERFAVVAERAPYELLKRRELPP